MDENLKLYKFLCIEHAEQVLEYIASRVGWHVQANDRLHFPGVRRLLNIDDSDTRLEFRLWYHTAQRRYYYNAGDYKDGFKEEPVVCNRCTISNMISMMLEFDKIAKQYELNERKKDISVVAQLYEA